MYKRIKRYAKSTVLVILILSSLVLVSQIWFGNYFVPGGYYDFAGDIKEFLNAPLERLFGNKASGGFSENIKILLKPEKVVVNMSGKRSALYRGREGYDEMLAVSGSLMSDFLLQNTKVISKDLVDTGEYYSVLKGKSFYVDYGNQFDSKLFSISVCGDNKTQFTNEISVVKEYMILFNDNILNTVSIYIRDYKTRNITKYTVEYNKAKLENAMTKHFNANLPENTSSYSFELNFHKDVNSDGSVPKVIFLPLILIDLMPGEKAELYPEPLPYFNQNGEMDPYTESLILKTFHINSTTMRKYIDLSNAKVFVENEGTLTIDPGGYLEYKTVEGGKGLNLGKESNKTAFDAYTTTTLAVDFVSAICNSFPKNMLSGLIISSDIVENTSKQGVYRITFDYYVGGVPVLQKDPKTGEPVPAVELMFENGYLKSYRQCLKTYGISETAMAMRPVINAVDSVVDGLKPKDSALVINKIGYCYLDDGSGLLSRKWAISVAERNGFLVLN